jgi:hypothetical protein
MLSGLLRDFRVARMAPNVRGASVLGVFLCRPRRSGFSLHRTGRMAMLHPLRGRNVHARVPLRSFSIRPRIRPEKRLRSSPAFLLLFPCPNVPGPPGNTPLYPPVLYLADRGYAGLCNFVCEAIRGRRLLEQQRWNRAC